MKLSFILMALCLQVSAEISAQRITISVKDASLEHVLKDIRKQSGYDFIYTRDVLTNASPVNLKVRNAELKYVLNVCLSNQQITYSIIENVVVLKKAPESTSGFKKKEQADSVDVRGRVVNEQGAPVLATVTVKGTNKATSTNEN